MEHQVPEKIDCRVIKNDRLAKVGILPSDRDGMFRSPHSATVATTLDGGYLVAYFAGTHESHPDTAIWLNRYENDNWLPPVRVADGGGQSRPVPFVEGLAGDSPRDADCGDSPPRL